MALIDSTKALIDEVVSIHYRIDAAKVAAAAYAPLRAQILSSLQDELHAIWKLRPWTFKYVDADVTLKKENLPTDTGYAAACPADWANEGKQGGVWLADPDNGEVVWRRRGDVRSLQLTYPTMTGTPECYSVDGLRNLIVFPKTTGSNRTLHVSYEMAVPTLTDETTDAGGLDLVPTDWIRGVLYLGTLLRESRRKGESQIIQVQAAYYQNAIFSLVVDEEQGKAESASLPRFPGAADVYDWP